MEVSHAITLIQSVGFPIFVSMWLLLRKERNEERLVTALQDLKMVILDYHRRNECK